MHSGFAALRERLPMNCRRQPDAYRWGEAAQADIDRVQQLWRALREGRDDGEFLCGRFGIVDAMFAPVAVRFRGYGVPMDDVAARYCDALSSLPAMREWTGDALAESERIAATDARVQA